MPLRHHNNRVNPLELYDLHRSIRNVGRACRQLISDWRNVHAETRRDRAREMAHGGPPQPSSETR